MALARGRDEGDAMTKLERSLRADLKRALRLLERHARWSHLDLDLNEDLSKLGNCKRALDIRTLRFLASAREQWLLAVAPPSPPTEPEEPRCPKCGGETRVYLDQVDTEPTTRHIVCASGCSTQEPR